MRILGGTLRGRRLAVVQGVRPSEARLREALFSIWHGRIEGSRFLDLFAGSGSVGLEALSRGARQAVFVESDRRVSATLRRHLEELAPTAAQLWRARLPRDLRRAASAGARHQPAGKFDLIFADPPYRFADYEDLVRYAAAWLGADGEMAIEHSARREPAAAAGALRLGDRRSYGESCLSFYRLADAG